MQVPVDRKFASKNEGFGSEEQLCILRDSKEDFGRITTVLFCGDLRQFRPVQERSILLSRRIPTVMY